MLSYATPDDKMSWDQYVDNHGEGSFCHLWGWKDVIEETMGHTAYYVKACDSDKQIVGLLPLVEMKSKLFGHVLMSTPFCMYGGAIADNQDIKSQLEAEACALAERLGVDYLELRYQSKQASTLLEKSVHSYFVKPLADNDDNILQAIKKKQRAVVRHSLKNNLVFSVNKDTDTLYDIYSTSVRNLGTPVFSKKLFTSLVKHFPEQVDVLTVSSENKAVSSVMSFYYKNRVMPYYGGGLAEARQLKSNDFMYYQLMCHAASIGCNEFDFGRSKNDSGAFKYKGTWGIDAQPLYHYYHLVNASELPNLSPNNPKFQLMITLWQKLPLKVSQIIGPLLSKYLG